MADVKIGEEEHASPVKRKPDPPESIEEALDEEEHEADSIKKRKLETPSYNDAFSRAADEKKADLKQPKNTSHPEDEEEDDDEEDYEGEEDDDGDEDAQSDGEEAIVNSKGKGIARDDKGKGKLIEESEDDDDSSDDCESELSGVDSDLSDDPLAEVDMNNILPSRTRRRAAQPGLHISNDRDHGSDP
ncbi:putative histone H2A.Z-specific chaperone CHZ1 [Abeliophyllum distichum]|uniref:Histone H2A.Z-specific chaperone CHZ1 n=1 Tax=Abeliophyllum distichum TaxID=126358 RepID=A0ABD1SYJ8_9LAMI